MSDANAARLRVVVDNQSDGFSTTGAWFESSADGAFRGSSIYAMDDATATWTANLPESGVYRVQAWWTCWWNRAKSAPFTISHMDGETTVRRNQRRDASCGRWKALGKFNFAAGDASMTLTREPWDKITTSADAVRFVKLEELPAGAGNTETGTTETGTTETGGTETGSGTTGTGTTQPTTPATLSEFIKIDQLGYQPSMQKIAVIANPQQGFNVPASAYAPASTFEVRSTADDSVAFSGPISAWNNGATDAQSGDQVWHFDFSALTTTGSYYVFDPVNNLASYPFEVTANPYLDTLKAAVKTFFYQRAGADKLPPYADANWSDVASHLGSEMDDDARAIHVDDPSQSDAATSLDLSGGWYDAGDFNKYINFADGVVHELLLAYEENPSIWGDNWNLPESGNGTPDLLDEVRYELDWMLKMQQTDGGVLHKVSSIDWSFTEAAATEAPSADRVPRRYAPVTASATISAAGTFAHAANVFASIDAAYAAELESAALAAWQWLENNPSLIPSEYDNAGFMNADAEDDAYAQAANRFNAAVYLHALTGDAAFQSYIEANRADARLLSDDSYLQYQGLDFENQNALLYYSAQANSDAALVAEIQDSFLFNISNPWVDFAPKLQMDNQTDGYLAYLDGYSWGSNRNKGHAGSMLIAAATYGFAADAAALENGAGQFVHYLHGVNPMNVFYLSNMAGYGAENSVDQFYHMWFRDGSLWDSTVDSFGPPPGFVVGGANEYYDIAGVKMSETSTVNIHDQPATKKYRSWNTLGDDQVWDHQSYRISENSITYQAAYIRLLSKFVD